MKCTTLPLPALALATAVLLVPVDAQVADATRARSRGATTAVGVPAAGQIPILPPAAAPRSAPLVVAEAVAPPIPAPGGTLSPDPEWFPGEPGLARSLHDGAGGLDDPGTLPGGTTDREPVPEPETWGLMLMSLAVVGMAIARYGLHDRPDRSPRPS